MEMGIAALSVAMNQQQVRQDVGTSVLKTVMGEMQDVGDMVSTLAAQPYLGANVDIGA